MVELKDETTSPHKYIKNKSMNITVLTEHLLNTSKDLRHLKGQKIPMQLGRMKEILKMEETGRAQYPW